MAPHEVVRRPYASGDPYHGLVHEDVDLMVAAELWKEVSAAGRDAGRNRWHGAEPREASHVGILAWRVCHG